MKKKLLLIVLPILLFTATSQAQIKYWDFGAQDLGTGYDNMMPVEYLNALSARLLNINWVNAEGTTVLNHAEGVGYAAKDGFQYENGESTESILAKFFDNQYATMGKFQIYSGKDEGTGGVFVSGNSTHTKPKLLPDLDDTSNMSYMKDSTNDRIITTNNALTRYDGSEVETSPTDYRRLTMPDTDADLFGLTGCIQFTSPGEKRWDRSGGRGFSMVLAAGEYLTVVGSGQYTDIEGDGTLGFSTGYFQFADYGGSGTPVDINDWGTGTGSATGPIDGTDQGDQSVRVMEFQSVDAGTYILRNRGGKIRIYRMYVSSTSIKSSVEASLSTKEIVSNISTNVKAINNRVYISDVKTSTEVNIYSVTGALVKSIKTDEDTSFEFKTGLWIATIKTAEGQKSVKFVTK